MTSEPDNNQLSQTTPVKRELISLECSEALSDVRVHVFDELESTNTWLLQREHKDAFEICVTELQTKGRGRRGHVWQTPARGITFSIKLTLPVPLTKIVGASLVCGVAVCETLHELGLSDVAVKWPNDILVGDAKLAGILVEVAGHTETTTTLVIGIGINYRSGAEAQLIDRTIIDLDRLFDGSPPERSRLIGRLCRQVFVSLSDALPLSATFVENWHRYDALSQKQVTVLSGVAHTDNSESITGLAAGIDEQGHLMLETASGTRFFSSAEVTIQASQQVRA